MHFAHFNFFSTFTISEMLVFFWVLDKTKSVPCKAHSVSGVGFWVVKGKEKSALKRKPCSVSSVCAQDYYSAFRKAGRALLFLAWTFKISSLLLASAGSNFTAITETKSLNSTL